MAKNDPLNGIDLDALTEEYGQGSKPISSEDHLKGIDLNALTSEYGGETKLAIPKKETELKYWQGLRNDPSWSGLIKRLSIGTMRGAKDFIDTGAEGLGKGTSYIADTVLPTKLALPVKQSVDSMIAENKSARNEYDKEYPSSEGIIPNSTDVGRIGGQIIATAPMMPTKIMQGVNAAVGAAPSVVNGIKIAAPMVNRLVGAAGTGAIGGSVLGASTSSINDKSLGENVREGLVSGLIGGPIIAGAGQLGKSVAGSLIGKVSTKTAELAKRAEELGIDLKGTQVSGSPFLKKYDQMSGMLPFSGSQGITDKQINQFTRAVSRTFGKDTSEITPEVVADARKKIGTGMENIYKSSTVKADNTLASDLKKVINDAQATHAETELKPIITQIQNVISKIDRNGEISGEAYHGLTKYDAVLSKAQQSSNPNIRNSANEIRQSLEKALDRSLAPDQKEALNKLRAQYKAAMTVKELVDQSAEGHVSPLKLMQKVNKSPGGKLRSGELGELADIGRKFFPTPADSGTPLGEAILGGLAKVVHSPVSAGGALGAALLHGSALADIITGGAGLIANRYVRKSINSNAVKNALIRSGMGETHGVTNKLIDYVAPYSSAISKRKDEDTHKLKIDYSR